MAITWLTPRRGDSRKNKGADCAARIGSTKGDKGSHPTYVTLYPEFMKEMRFLCGDRFDVGFDENNILIRRSSSGGFLAGAQSKGGADREKAIGKVVQSQIKFTLHEKIDVRYVKRNEITVMEDGTLLIPKQPQSQETSP